LTDSPFLYQGNLPREFLTIFFLRKVLEGEDSYPRKIESKIDIIVTARAITAVISQRTLVAI